MPFTASMDTSGPWLLLEFSGVVDGPQLIASRAQAAALNADVAVRDFLLDFSAVTEFVLSHESVEEIHAIDRERRNVLQSGRCAMVAPRDLVEIGASFLAAVSPLDLDYRTFFGRSNAEAWLRGDHEGAPPPLPRRR
jgi:hypothetical protein